MKDCRECKHSELDNGRWFCDQRKEGLRFTTAHMRASNQPCGFDAKLFNRKIQNVQTSGARHD